MNFKKPLVIAAASAVAVTALVGCVPRDAANTSGSPVNPTAPQSSGSTGHTGTATTAPTAPSTTPATAVTTFADAKQALQTAAQAHPGGVITDLDYEEHGNHWDVEIFKADSTMVTLELDPTGKTILLQEPLELADSDDIADAKRAVINILDALNAVPSHLQGTVYDINLDNVGTQLLWEITVLPAGQTAQTRVLVDAVTGSLV
ncbi:PepSY domain-containing protein [Canibacter oris]|uniref:Putative membrane protein YkoI n=1 Tax=Canibacter oris TaxID=1365628 RepID=A0A840DPV4_9MICO|nr:PepSY domain-containing protein [Canibacter oris]MBB4071226.1 putative membrane protein YkoI [Canibacter oris]